MLAPGGRLFIWTFAPEHFTGFYLAPYLPSLPAVDLARFPDPRVLAGELRRAGFADVEQHVLRQERGRSAAARPPRACGPATSRPCTCCPKPRSRQGVARLEAEAAAGEPALATALDWRLLVATSMSTAVHCA